MKAHIGAVTESGLVHQVHGTAANVTDITEIAHLLHGCMDRTHGEENVICADGGYAGVEKRQGHEGRPVFWQTAARLSTYKHLSKRSVLYNTRRKVEKVKDQAQALAWA
jgi:IS5 family transposase